MSLTVDIHSHIYPEWFLDLFRSRTEAPRVVEGEDGDRFLLFITPDGTESGPVVTAEYTTVAAKLAFMDRHGIDRSVVSLGNPWLEVFEAGASVEMAREANSRMATLADETSGKLYGMGVLPSARPDAAAAIVEEVAGEPGLRGVISSTTVCGLLLDDPALDPVWEALATNRVPLLVHPMLARLPPDLTGYGIALSAGVGFPFQTTVALGRLLLGGVLGRHPDLRVVAAHGGGALPFLVGRLEGTHHRDPADEPLREAARRLLLDAALYEADTVRMAADLVGADHLLFGTDHPFPNADAARISDAIRAGLGEAEAALVMGTAAAEWYDLPT
jgi:aminocarboxymuconate-semialdehyde decarboxylase